MAKGIEDTLFYCYNRFIALNEVGGELDLFSLSPQEFHRRNREMLEHYPRTMLATTTHDTKRGEDMRMRLVLLSEIPHRFSAAVRAWSTANEQYRTKFRPDRNSEYLYYQTLVGAWPIETERLQAYMLKAIREAKQHTSWTAPDEEYEQAVAAFIEQTMADRQFCAGSREVRCRFDWSGASEFSGANSVKTSVAGRARYLSRFGTVGFPARGSR